MATKKNKKPSVKKVANKSNKKSPKIFKISKKSPEHIYSATRKVVAKPKNKTKNYKWLKTNYQTILAVVLAACCIIFLVFIIGLYFKHKQNNQYYAGLQSDSAQDLEQIKAKERIIGTKEQLQSEIINFQSAPDDLKQYLIKDYANFKSKCIVNGKLIGPATYQIAAVVYDSYAKILMDCEGEDSQILAKVGGRWAVVHAGNAAPNCNDVNSLSIPMGIAPTCTDGRVLYPNANP